MKNSNFSDTYLEDIQKKVALFIVLAVSGLLLFMVVADVILGLNPPLFQLIRFLGIIPFVLIFFVMKRFGYFRAGLIIFYVYALVLISFAYKYNDGFAGPVFFTLSIFLAFVSTVFNGWLKFVMLFLTFGLFSALYLFEVKGWLAVESNQIGINHPFFESFMIMFISGLFLFFSIHYWVDKFREKNNSLILIQAEKENALKELDSLNTKKNQLIALLSHDLRNPIGMLGQTLDLVDKDAFEEGELELILKNLRNQSYHLSGMLNNTLNWVLAELENKELEMEKISLYHLTNEMKGGMLVQSTSKNQTITCRIIGEDQILEIEAAEIRIILKNLLDNAIKFAPVGSEIYFDLNISNHEITWRIENEGKPIHQEDQANLFEFKVKTTFGTMREKGTGIGLPLCKKIADKLQMELDFSRTENGKNSFFLKKRLN